MASAISQCDDGFEDDVEGDTFEIEKITWRRLEELYRKVISVYNTYA
jgi:hypothetical protein